jgi:hypothetical protein
MSQMMTYAEEYYGLKNIAQDKWNGKDYISAENFTPLREKINQMKP